MCTVKTCVVLCEELDKAKEALSHLNDNIRRLIGGREPKEVTLRGERKERKRHLSGAVRNNDIKDDTDSTPRKIKRRYDNEKSVFNRLSASSPRPKNDSIEENRPRVNSHVIRELPSRQEIVEAQGTDAASRARNRRIFGSLLGTLHKFCQEESRLKQREEKKAKIEKKLEEQETQEKESIRKEREALLVDRKQAQMKILKLECKINRLRDFEIWEKNKLYETKFIVTQTKPQIFFIPKNMDKQTEKLLKTSSKEIKIAMAKKRASLLDELQDIDNRFGVNDETELFANARYVPENQTSDMNIDEVQENDDKNCDSSSSVTKTKLKKLMAEL